MDTPSQNIYSNTIRPSQELLQSAHYSLYSPLRRHITEFLPPEGVLEIDKAFMAADKAHAGQVRASGEPYIIHPIAVATIVAQLHLDTETVVAALLHDVVEDTSIADSDIEREYGPAVKDLVEGVTKLDKLRFRDYREAQAENFRKMILAMTKDLRVILIKLADRTHNMRTLGALRDDKRRRIARETLDVFAPIANRLGISEIKSELEELGMAALYPMRYRVLKSAVSLARNNRNEIVIQILDAIKARLKENNIKASVSGREKHIYSIYKKMIRKELKFREIMDVYAFRIILTDVDTCYRVLGVMHNLFKPRPGLFKDYIAVPKINGYQSLHTSLVGPRGVPIEIQIRTEFMDQMAARGVAAHWSYKESGSEPVSTTSQKQAQLWLRNLVDLQQNAGSSQEFVESVKTDLFLDNIYVFTPDGTIYDLPAGSTPVDFAFAVHTDIGMHCLGARVDHQPYPLTRPLSSGQSVEIITSRIAQPNAIWLASVVTSRARTRIRQYLKSLKIQECELIGRRLLSNALPHGITLQSISKEQMARTLNEFSKNSVNELYADIALGNLLTAAVSRSLCPDNEQGASQSPVTGTGGVPCSYAQCCLPIPGDEIVAHMSRRGLVIHNVNCNNLSDAGNNKGKLIHVDWDRSIAANMEFQSGLRIDLEKRQGIVSEISNVIDICGSRLDSIHFDAKDSNKLTIHIIIAVRDRLHLASIMRKIKVVPNVLGIYRKR